MGRKRRGDPVHGWLALDKPSGMTSAQAVAKAKRLFNAQKTGHAGTLDPLASGLLPIAFGEATKLSSFSMHGTKTYRFTVAWGAETETDDTEGDLVESSSARPCTQDIRRMLPQFTGTILQTPPDYSAIKVKGQRAYDLARQGEEVALQPREVEIERLDLIETSDAVSAVFEAVCSKGTYVRALARDMGRHLGCLGHVSALRRTRVGGLNEEDMISLEKLEGLSHSAAGFEPLKEFLLPVETVLDDIPALAISRQEATRLRHGQPVLLRGRDAPILEGTVFVTSHGTPVALAEMEQGALHPKRVLNMTD